MTAKFEIQNEFANPLDNFRSYSYHFIMTVASTTNAFNKMIAAGNSSAPLLSMVDGIQIGERLKFMSGEQEEAYLLVDTRRFSAYSITRVEMEHIYGTGTRVNPTIPASILSMELIDTTGLTFFNFMMDVFRNKLRTTRASAFFLLAILFVGHKDDGSTEVVSTCYIPLTLLLMGFEFTSSGSVYQLEMMELEGAPQRGGTLEQINSLGDVLKATTQGGKNTIGQMLQNLENELNIQSLQFYQKYRNEALASGRVKSDEPTGKLVQYMITIPEKWKGYEITLASRSKNVEKEFIKARKEYQEATNLQTGSTASTGGTGSDVYSQISFSTSMTITDAIKTILESSTQLLQESSKEKRLKGEAIAFKTVTNLTSDNNTFIIHYDIYPYAIPKVDEKTKKVAEQGNIKRSSVGVASDIKNLLTYNYIFTGRNSHIRNLKIEYTPESVFALDTNMDIGRARFAKNAERGAQRQGNMQQSGDGAPKAIEFQQEVRPNDPIFFSIQSTDQQDNNAKQKVEDAAQSAESWKAKQEYRQTFAMLHFLSTINLSMSIRGNPELIRKFADRDVRGGIAPHPKIVNTETLNRFASQAQNTARDNYNGTLRSSLESAKALYESQYTQPRIARALSSAPVTELNQGPDISTYPLFVKINIMAPNVDYTGQHRNGEPFFTDRFFFDGVYYTLMIKTLFEGGEFSHDLELIPFDVDGSFMMSGDGK